VRRFLSRDFVIVATITPLDRLRGAPLQSPDAFTQLKHCIHPFGLPREIGWNSKPQ
jgi:hypothetical protein